MSKIVCEICGTTYPETAPCCPICGWKKDGTAENITISETEPVNDALDMDFLNVEDSLPEVMADPVADDFLKDLEISDDSVSEDLDLSDVESLLADEKPKKVFDFDAVNPAAGQAAAKSAPKKAKQQPKKPAPKPAPKPVEPEPEDEEEEEDETKGSGFLVFILIVLIIALLLVSGFIFWKYYLPGKNAQTVPTETVTETTEEPTTETTIPTVPCTGLSLVSGMEKLSYEGQNWLLHIKASPENTTDIIVFVSSDESVATVNEEGRVTAVGEGEAKIVITCGNQKIECPVIVAYEEETEATEPETEATEATEAAEETEASATEETEAPAPGTKDVVLKLKPKFEDLTFGIRGVYRTLQLDCDLTNEEVTWSSRNTGVAVVNEKGEVTAVGSGQTVIYGKYGDQTVECIVRCYF